MAKTKQISALESKRHLASAEQDSILASYCRSLVNLIQDKDRDPISFSSFWRT